VKYPIIFSLNP